MKDNEPLTPEDQQLQRKAEGVRRSVAEFIEALEKAEQANVLAEDIVIKEKPGGVRIGYALTPSKLTLVSDKHKLEFKFIPLTKPPTHD